MCRERPPTFIQYSLQLPPDAASKLVESFLFQMKPNDQLALAAAVLTMAAATLLAGYIPARNASRINPVVALRHE